VPFDPQPLDERTRHRHQSIGSCVQILGAMQTRRRLNPQSTVKTKLSDSEINALVAEKVAGLTVERTKHGPIERCRLVVGGEDFGPWTQELPDYVNGLNAVHEAEKKLTEDQWAVYCRTLNELVCGCGHNMVCGYTVSATARQRCLALLKSKGIEL